jgi:methionyl-tRNA formyltransferase
MLQLFETHLPQIAAGDIPRLRQADGPAAHRSTEIETASKIGLDEKYTGRALLNLIRAKQFPPHAPAWFEADGIVYDVTLSISRRQ